MLCVFGLVSVQAAQISGRWAPGAKIPVWVGESRERQDDPDLVERAMKVWTDAGQASFTLSRSKDQGAARIRVRFANGDALLGEASPVTDRFTGYITGADIAIAANLNGDRLVQRIIVYMTALHELGHALGMRHSAAFDDIMYYFRRPEDPDEYFGAYRRKVRSERDIGSSRATGLSPRDLEALNALYMGSGPESWRWRPPTP